MFTLKDTSTLTDLELLTQFKKSGALNSLGALFSRYTSLVYGVALKYLKDRDDAKDAVMQIFEKLVQVLNDHDVENFKSWLYVTSKNHCLMHLRSKKSRPTESISPHFMENGMLLHHEEEPEMEQNLSKLEGCVDKLEGEQKQCVTLFFLQERCYKEITALTGFELNKVKSYIQNGKRNLRICMENNA